MPPTDRQLSMADPPFAPAASKSDRHVLEELVTAAKERAAMAERQRRCRRRRRAAVVLVAGEIDAGLVEGLIESGALPYDHTNDKAAVFRALVKAARGWSARRLSRVTG